MNFESDFDFKNKIKDLGSCVDFVDMDESQWDYMGEDEGEITEEMWQEMELYFSDDL